MVANVDRVYDVTDHVDYVPIHQIIEHAGVNQQQMQYSMLHLLLNLYPNPSLYSPFNCELRCHSVSHQCDNTIPMVPGALTPGQSAPEIESISKETNTL
jgi:hypothetical protein